MKRILPLIGLILLFLTCSFSQNLSFRFVSENEEDNVYEVVFSIVGIEDDQHAKQIMQSFYAYEQVKSCEIFYNKRCRIVVDMSVDVKSAKKCREILLSNNVDFDIDYIKCGSKEKYEEMHLKKMQNPCKYKANPIPSNQWIYPPSFPKLIDTGNPEMDKALYAKAKQDWIKEHPEEWLQMTGTEHLDYFAFEHFSKERK